MTEQLLYRVPMDNGEVVFVQPVSIFARQGILERGRELFPDPDPEAFRIPLKGAPEGVEAYEPLEDNIEWKRAMLEVSNGRLNHMREALLDIGVVTDCEDGQETVIARYAHQLAALRRYASVPDDPWLATVKMCVVTTGDDIRRIFRVASQVLEQDEIRSGVELFRRDIQRETPAANHRRKKSPRAGTEAGRT